MNSELNKLSGLRDKANNILQKLLLALEPHDIYRASSAWNDLYYSSSTLKSFNKRADAFKAAHSAEFGMIAWAISAVRINWESYESARIAEKARMTEKRAAVAARAKSKSVLGVDLKKHEFATEATYKTLRAALEPVRISVEAHYVELLNEQLANFEEMISTAFGIKNAFLEKNRGGFTVQNLPKDFTFFFEVRDYRAGRYETEIKRTDVADRIAARAKEAAESEVSSFSGKLAGKIDRDASGKTLVTVRVYGSTLWNNSNLEATLSDGSKQLWKTQIIWNRSYLGTEFNQWPSRRAS